MRSYELTFDVPRRMWWTSNAREHWRARQRKTRELRELAIWTARAARPPRFERARAIAHVSYPTNGPADPGNVVGTVLKALIDGLVAAGLFPDDDSTHLIGPDPRRGPKTGVQGLWRVRLEVYELDAEDAPLVLRMVPSEAASTSPRPIELGATDDADKP